MRKCHFCLVILQHLHAGQLVLQAAVVYIYHVPQAVSVSCPSDYSTAATSSPSQSRHFDRLEQQTLYVCSPFGSSMTFGHAESKQSVGSSSQRQGSLLSDMRVGGSDTAQLKLRLWGADSAFIKVTSCWFRKTSTVPFALLRFHMIMLRI